MALPWIIGAAVAVVGKKIYDEISERNERMRGYEEEDRRREQEKEEREKREREARQEAARRAAEKQAKKLEFTINQWDNLVSEYGLEKVLEVNTEELAKMSQEQATETVLEALNSWDILEKIKESKSEERKLQSLLGALEKNL